MIDYDRSMLEFETSRIGKFVITLKNKEGYLADIIKKPTPGMIKKVFKQDGYVGVSMNIFSLEYNLILPVLEQLGPNPERDEKELPEAIKILATKSQNSVYTYPLAEHVPDLTSKNDIVQVQQYLEKHFPEFSF